MEWIVVVAVVVGLLIWAGAKRNRRAEALADASLFWPDGDAAEDGLAGNQWHYDLRSMTAEFRFYSAGVPDEVYRYHLRRQDGPRWELMLTPESFALNRDRVSKLDPNNMILSTPEQKLKELEEELAWHSVRPDHQGGLEMHYQVFLRLVANP